LNQTNLWLRSPANMASIETRIAELESLLSQAHAENELF
jgi:hypothetical protein